jgi:hypothetical protein
LTEAEKQDDADKKQQVEDVAAAARAKENEEATAMELDMLAMTTPTLQEDRPGVSAGPAEFARAVDVLEDNMCRVHFADAFPALTEMSKPLVQSTSRTTVLIDVTSSSGIVAQDFLDAAFEIWRTYEAGMNPDAPQRTRFRVVVLVGSRFDIMHKVEAKAKATFPASWACALVQIRKKETQSVRSRPSYAMLLCPGVEVTAVELTTLDLPGGPSRKYALASEGLVLRCTESECPLRSQTARDDIQRNLALGKTPDVSMEIRKEDRCGDLMELMAAEMGLPDAEYDAESAQGSLDDFAIGQSEKQRDCIVELWPHAHIVADVQSILTAVGAGDKMNVLVALSGSAHPAPWLAALALNVPVVVCTARFSEHSQAHALGLGRHLRRRALSLVRSVSTGTAFGQDLQFLPAAVVGPQILEAYDVSQGALWNDGLNKMPPAGPLSRESAGLLAQELEQYSLSVTTVHETRGRGIVSLRHVAEGEVVCKASCLFYDSLHVLKSFLAMPGNDALEDRVVEIPNVMRSLLYSKPETQPKTKRM